MPVPFNKLPTGNPDLDRIQQNLVAAFAAIPDTSGPKVINVSSDYRVTGQEDVLHVNAQAGPVRITLQSPSPTNRPLTIKQVNLQNSASKVNQVTIVSADGSKTIAGSNTYALDTTGTGSVSITADNLQHYPVAGAGGNPAVSPTSAGSSVTIINQGGSGIQSVNGAGPILSSGGDNPVVSKVQWSNGFVQYVSPTGSDSNDGLAWDTAKQTIYAATTACVGAGGGTVYFANGSTFGGPVSGQGLWLRDDGVNVPGWILQNGAKLSFVGVAGNLTGNFPFERPGAAWVTGAAEDYLHPDIWIAATDTPVDISYWHSEAQGTRQGVMAPVRLGWDYVRQSGGALERLNVTSATRTAGVLGSTYGSTTYTVDLSTATSWTITAASRAVVSGVETVTLTISRPITIANTPWSPGAWIRVNTGGDSDFPNGDYQVTATSLDQGPQNIANLSVTVSYAQAGSNISKSLSGTIVSHGCVATDRVLGEFSNSEFVTCCAYLVTGSTIDTITVQDPYGYSPRSPGFGPASNIGTVCKQIRGRQYCDSINFDQCSFYGLAEFSGDRFTYASTVDVGGVNAIPLNFSTCYIAGQVNWNYTSVDTTNVDYDRTKVSILGDAGPGPAGAAFNAFDCMSQDGSVRWYGRSTPGSLRVNGWLQDTGSLPLPTICIPQCNPFCTIDLDYISLADASTPAIQIIGDHDPNLVRIGYVFGSIDATAITGPLGVRSGIYSAGALDSPWVTGWQGTWPGGLTVRHVGINRALGPTAARYENKFPAVSTWGTPIPLPAGITVSTGFPAPDGSSTAIKIVNSNGGSTVVQLGPYPITVGVSTGDRIAIGAYINAPAQAQLQASSYSVGNVIFTGGLGSVTASQPLGASGWQWGVGYNSVASAVPGAFVFVQFTVPSGTTYLWGPTLIYIPASVPDPDAWEVMANLRNQPLYLKVGGTGTMESQPFIAHGGIGVDASVLATPSGTASPTKNLPLLAADGTIQAYIPTIPTNSGLPTGTVTSVGGTAPIASSGGATPAISLAYDNTSLNLNGSSQLERAALTGDATATAGSNSVTVPSKGQVYATASDPSYDYLGNKVTSANGTITLTAPGGTIISFDITPGTLKRTVNYYMDAYNPINNPGFLQSSSNSAVSSANIAYPLGVAAVNARLTAYITDNTLTTSGGTGLITFAYYNNNVLIHSTTALTTVSPGTIVDTGVSTSIGSTATTDVWSVRLSSTGTYASGAISFTAVLTLGY